MDNIDSVTCEFMKLDKNWNEYTFVAFDTETSGGYPVGYDIVEFGAVKWRAGQVIDRLQFLARPREKMTDFIIKIHGIKNEMVEGLPSFSEQIDSVESFFADSVLIAHHAPFDMGFLAYEFEKVGHKLPGSVVLCSSLLSRKVILESPNHKLQTLITVLGLDRGQAHRAGDDASACLEVGLECMKRLESKGLAKLSDILEVQEKPLDWPNFSLLNSGNDKLQSMVQSIEQKRPVEVDYAGGRVAVRTISPIGIVRNPDGDYVMAKCHIDGSQKRFYLDKIKDFQII